MTTSKPHATIRPIVRQQDGPPVCACTSDSEDDEIADTSPDSSYERLPPLTPSSHPLPQASTSTIASTASVKTYDSRDSDDDEPRRRHPVREVDEDEAADDFTEETENPVQLLPSDAAIPTMLPVYHLPPINDYPIRATSPDVFGQLFPTMDRLTVRHDDLTPDGNMNLRIETPPQFLLPPADLYPGNPGSPKISSRLLHREPKRPMAFQLFHLRMYDLARRDFSLRRYCRDSGREVCNSKREFVIEGQQRPPRDEDDDEDEHEKPQKHHHILNRPGSSGGSIQRTVTEAFRSVTTPFQRSSHSSSLFFRRPSTTPNHRRCLSRSSSSRRSRSRSARSSASWDAPSSSSCSNPVFSTDKLSLAPSTAPSSRSGCRDVPAQKPIKLATETIKLEFSNYARVEVTRTQGVEDKGVAAILYIFEWWGHAYAWRRVVDDNTETVSYHLMRDGKGHPIAHIVPETRGIEEIRRDEEVGGWVPPCHIWISDKSVINAQTDVAEIIMATGLITLVDDSIRTRWQIQPRKEPMRSLTSDSIPHRHRDLLSSIFHRRRSEQYTSRGKPLATY